MLKTSKFKINTTKKNEMDENKKYYHLMRLFKSLIKELPQKVLLRKCRKVSLRNCRKVSLRNCHKVSLRICRKVSLRICRKVSLRICRKVSLRICRKVSLRICHKVSLRSSHEIWQETRCAISALHKANWLPCFLLTEYY